MEKIELVCGGLKVSPLVWGAMRILDSDATNTAEKLGGTIDHAASLGITTIDTADIYGNFGGEEALGAGLKHAAVQRDRLQIITKCGIRLPSDKQPDCRVGHYDFRSDYLMGQVDRSLKMLDLEQVDLLLLHRPDYLMDADEVAGFLTDVIRSGKAATVGVSNFTVHQLELLRSRYTEPLQTNQMEISAYHDEVLDDGTLEQAQRLGMRPMAWSPIKGAVPSGEAEAGKSQRLTDALARVGENHGVQDLTVVALAWVLKLPAQPVPVIGTTQIPRIEQSIQALDLKLSHQEWYEILIASRGEGMP